MFVFGGLVVIGVGVVLALIAHMANETLHIIAKLGTLRDVRALDSSVDIVRDSIKALASLGFWMLVVIIIDRVLYLIAPSAEQAAKMMATVSAWKGGISTTSTATTSGPGGTATTTTTAGPTAAPAPPASPLGTVITTIEKNWAKYAG